MVSDWRRAGVACFLSRSGAAVIRRLLRICGSIRNNGAPLPVALFSAQPSLSHQYGTSQPSILMPIP